MFKIADIAAIEAHCIAENKALSASKLAYENNQLHSLTIHKSVLENLTPLLRIYVGAALHLYGDLNDIQLIKIHITSGKVTLLGYENFEDDPVPKLKERVKIKMAEQKVDFFDYKNVTAQTPLLDKNDFLV